MRDNYWRYVPGTLHLPGTSQKPQTRQSQLNALAGCDLHGKRDV